MINWATLEEKQNLKSRQERSLGRVSGSCTMRSLKKSKQGLGLRPEEETGIESAVKHILNLIIFATTILLEISKLFLGILYMKDWM